MTTERIFDIAHRANINHKTTTEGEVVIYEDHRTIVNVLFHLKEKKDLDEPVDLIMFDDHDDFCHVSDPVKDKLDQFLKSPNSRDLCSIIEFDLNSLDDDWVTTAMELNLIGNVFLFNSNESSVHFREEYQTRNFGTKYLYNVGDVWSALGHFGKLNDPIKKEYQPLWDDFGWTLDKGKFYHDPKRKFVFDIDLDCFTTRILDKTKAIPDEIIIPKLTETSMKSYHHYYSSQYFMKDLIKRSELVTMCYENGCCGGIREAHKIFNMVDYVLFDNEIGE